MYLCNDRYRYCTYCIFIPIWKRGRLEAERALHPISHSSTTLQHYFFFLPNDSKSQYIVCRALNYNAYMGNRDVSICSSKPSQAALQSSYFVQEHRRQLQLGKSRQIENSKEICQAG